MDGRSKGFLPVLEPVNGATELLQHQQQEDFLRIDGFFRAKPTAYVRGDHAQAVEARAGNPRELPAQNLWDLRRAIQDIALASRIEQRYGATRLHWTTDDALELEGLLDDRDRLG